MFLVSIINMSKRTESGVYKKLDRSLQYTKTNNLSIIIRDDQTLLLTYDFKDGFLKFPET